MSGRLWMHFSMLSVVLRVMVTSAATAVGHYCWHAARQRRRRHREWARLAAGLRDLDEDLGLVRAAEQGSPRRHH